MNFMNPLMKSIACNDDNNNNNNNDNNYDKTQTVASHFVPLVVSYPVVSYPTGSFRTQSAHSFRTQLGRFVPKLIKYVFQVSNWRKNITLTRAVIVKKVTSKNDRLFN